MSTCEHQGRDTVLQTGVKIHWSRRSASSCFNRVWRVTKSSAKHQSMLNPWVMQHQPWPSLSAWTRTRSLHGCRNFYLLILPSLSFSLSFSLSLLLLILDRTDVSVRRAPAARACASCRASVYSLRTRKFYSILHFRDRIYFALPWTASALRCKLFLAQNHDSMTPCPSLNLSL